MKKQLVQVKMSIIGQLSVYGEERVQKEICNYTFGRYFYGMKFICGCLLSMQHFGKYFGENGQMSFSCKKNQHFAQFPKLIREMPFFCNSIFSKLSFNVKLDL